MSTALLEVRQLSYLTNGPYSFSLRAGEAIGLTGSSGVGKTQLLRALVQCILYEGEIFYKDVAAESFAPPEWRKTIGLVPAESVWWYDRVGQHFTAESHGQLLDDFLPRLGFSKDVLTWEISRLSSGERQRLAIIRALLIGPSVLLLDEPCSALDPRSVSMVEQLLLEYKERGATAMIWVSHDYAQLGRVADFCYEVRNDGLHKLRIPNQSNITQV